MKKVLLGLVAVIAVLAVVVALQPSTFHIERSTEIAAPPEIPFVMIADFKQWAAWSPWEKIDPTMKKEYGGDAGEVGATYHWVGNDDVGEGRMTLVDVKPLSELGIKLEFMKPFEQTNRTTFKLAPSAGAEGGAPRTSVTWEMDGNNNFISKAVGLFMNIDTMVGRDFEMGLASLKQGAEAEEAKRKAADPNMAAKTSTAP